MTDTSVLVVDDDLAVRMAVGESLHREGYKLMFAANGAEALDLIPEASPSVIILDLKMPVMNGLEFLAELHLKPADPYAVIVLTALGDGDLLGSCYESGITTCIRKPFHSRELRGAVKSAIATKWHALRLSNRTEEVVLMDIRLPGMGGAEATRVSQEQHQILAVLVITSDGNEYAARVITADSSGHALEPFASRRLLQDAQTVAPGEIFVDQSRKAQVLGVVEELLRTHREPQPYRTVTERELEVLRILAMGATNKEIAINLSLSVNTVKYHLENIYRKLGAQNRTQAIRVASKFSLLTL